VSAVQVDVFDTEKRYHEHATVRRVERGRLAGGNGTLRLIRDLGSGSVAFERRRSDGLGWPRNRHRACFIYGKRV
jgi:hypothetical protein